MPQARYGMQGKNVLGLHKTDYGKFQREEWKVEKLRKLGDLGRKKYKKIGGKKKRPK